MKTIVHMPIFLTKENEIENRVFYTYFNLFGSSNYIAFYTTDDVSLEMLCNDNYKMKEIRSISHLEIKNATKEQKLTLAARVEM